MQTQKISVMAEVFILTPVVLNREMGSLQRNPQAQINWGSFFI